MFGIKRGMTLLQHFVICPLIIWSVTANSNSDFATDLTTGAAHDDDQYPWNARSRRASADPEKSLGGKWTTPTNDGTYHQHYSIHHQSLSPRNPNEDEHRRRNNGKDYTYIESQGAPISRITPISLIDLDYYEDNEQLYEEMDQLLKLRKILTDKENKESFKVNNRRGDMDPMISSPIATVIDTDTYPVRGDVATTRNKRQSYRNKNDGLWGFAEDEGTTSDDSQDYQRKWDQEYKLLNYIARNRPIVVGHADNLKSTGGSNPSKSSRIHEDTIDSSAQIMEHKGKAITTINMGTVKRPDKDKLNNLPVSAKIIIVRDSSSEKPMTSPQFLSRGNFDSDFEFPALSPHHQGLEASHFPVAPTPRPPSKPPSACVWAVLQCCPNNKDSRLTRCFEHMGCPGVNWDPNPCRPAIAEAARAQVVKYYTGSSQRSR